MQVLICIGCSVVASIIVTRYLAAHYFDLVNSYVDGVCSKTEELVQEVESTICKQQR